MTDSSYLRRTQDDDTPVRSQPEAEAGQSAAAAPAPDAGQTRTSTPNLRLRYRPAGVADGRAQLPDDRAAALTRQALEALGGQEERSLHLMPEPDVLTRLANDETLEFVARTDASALVPEEHSRLLGASGREEGVVNDEEFRREAELKPDDIDEIRRERQEMVRAFHAEQGAQLLDPGELVRALGPVPVQDHALDQQEGQSARGHGAGEGTQVAQAMPQGGPAPSAATADANGRGRQLLAGESGERALQLITQGISARFQTWLRKDGQWHKRSEWFKKHLARAWEYAPDALNPGTLLFAPKGRQRLASYLQTEPGQQPAQQREQTNGLKPSKASQEREASEQEAARGRTRKAAATGQVERQVKEARVRAVAAVTQTIAKNWAEARDLAWPLDATNDDLSAFVKTPQDGALNAWAASAPERQP